MLPKIKSKAFIRLLPQIQELREQGYSYDEVTSILEEQHGLILSVKQFSVYLARYKNTHAKKLEKQISASPSTTVFNQEDTQPPVNSDNQTKDYAFGSPAHKAKIQSETEELFKSSQSLGLKKLK
ncbi:hypothetical protein LVY74_17320 [Acinetobacter sp. ME22]|uniref:hypothetical protein n=1 Tax=Acinetobacter sp. ME22 TaxID=2904802 RepID=UPI001EDBBFB2|nr:hypothetical protein [Acinetobacter sp. ME22]MCG2575297.1 hypothetical protein [Acinetobacter sp. ME22]